jgi:hypothetical protein
MKAVIYKTAAGQPAFTVATRHGAPPVPEFPIARDITAIQWTDVMWQLAANYSPLALNTQHPDHSNAYHVGESGHDSLGGGMLSWSRRYATKPATRFEYPRAAVTYPGWYLEREPSSENTTVQVTYEYYLIGPEGFCDYANEDEIPLIPESRMTDTAGADVALLSGILLNDGGGVLFDTTPTLADYKDLVADDLAATGLYSLVLDCNLEPYAGNIIARVTRRVKAK